MLWKSKKCLMCGKKLKEDEIVRTIEYTYKDDKIAQAYFCEDCSNEFFENGLEVVRDLE